MAPRANPANTLRPVRLRRLSGWTGGQSRGTGCLHIGYWPFSELVLIDEWRDIGEAVTKFWGLPERPRAAARGRDAAASGRGEALSLN